MAIANTTVFGGFASSTVVGINPLSTQLSSLQTTNIVQSSIYGQTLGGFKTPTVTGTQRLSTFIKTAEDPVTSGSAATATQTWYYS